MNNPFETIETRLSNIETLLLEIKHQPLKSEQPTQAHDELLNVQQAAELLGLTVQTIYGKKARKEIPFMKMEDSNRLYFSRDDLMNHLKGGRSKSNDEVNKIANDYINKKYGETL